MYLRKVRKMTMSKYSHFWGKLFSFMLVVGALFSYNEALNYKDAKAAELIETDEEAAIKAGVLEIKEEYNYVSVEERSGYKDGTYIGSAKGYGGDIEAKVTLSDGKITGIEIVSAKGEDKEYMSMAEAVIGDMLSSGNTSVDTVSGATLTSNGIINAVKAAVSEAEYTETVKESQSE